MSELSANACKRHTATSKPCMTSLAISRRHCTHVRLQCLVSDYPPLDAHRYRLETKTVIVDEMVRKQTRRVKEMAGENRTR